MKPELHPQLNEVLVHCQCGNEFKTRTIKTELRVEICSNCHPYWTGKQKLMDTAGRVEKFQRKFAKKAEMDAAKAASSEAAVEAPATENTEA